MIKHDSALDMSEEDYDVVTAKIDAAVANGKALRLSAKNPILQCIRALSIWHSRMSDESRVVVTASALASATGNTFWTMGKAPLTLFASHNFEIENGLVAFDASRWVSGIRFDIYNEASKPIMLASPHLAILYEVRQMDGVSYVGLLGPLGVLEWVWMNLRDFKLGHDDDIAIHDADEEAFVRAVMGGRFTRKIENDVIKVFTTTKLTNSFMLPGHFAWLLSIALDGTLTDEDILSALRHALRPFREINRRLRYDSWRARAEQKEAY